MVPLLQSTGPVPANVKNLRLTLPITCRLSNGSAASLASIEAKNFVNPSAIPLPPKRCLLAFTARFPVMSERCAGGLLVILVFIGYCQNSGVMLHTIIPL